MKRPYLIALTGGIGSGKTTVLNLFAKKGVPCYVADVEAKKIMVQNQEVVKAIKNEFGEEAYTKDQTLNNEFLSSKVFNDEVKLEKLNRIVHPAVRNHFENWVSNQNTIFIIYESALIFETNQQDFFDEIILVTAPVEERINRVIKRSGLSKSDIKKRMNRQMNDNLKKDKVDYIIDNIKIKDTISKVKNIYDKILYKTQNKS